MNTPEPLETPSSYPPLTRPNIVVVSISRLQALCKQVSPRYQQRASIVGVREGYGDAVRAVHALQRERPIDVVLAAGSNGAYLREHLKLPVVTVKVHAFDILHAIAQASSHWPGAKIGLVMHHCAIRELEELKPLLNIALTQRAYQSLDEVPRVVDELVQDGCGVIVGPGMACDFAEQRGMAALFLYSVRSVEEAFEQAMELAQLHRREAAKRSRLNNIIAHLRDGIAAFDETGQLVAHNPAILDLLKLPRHNTSASELSQAVGPFMPQPRAPESAIDERIEDINGRTLIVHSVPIHEHGLRTGTVISMQDAQLVQRIDRTIRTSRRPRHLIARHELADYLGISPQANKVRRLATAFAQHDATVLLTGESGTGKELIAQGMHNASQRRGNPFVAFNCAALPESLIESELFGYEDGAFTGARRTGKAGLFELAHTGTIFLDEIGEMQPTLQSRLLRVLQERELLRLGAERPTPIDVRVISATHRDLRQLVSQGTFRGDLYFRLNLLHIELPPLRERADDIEVLAECLLERLVRQYRLPATLPQTMMRTIRPLLQRYAWPGNVRELENVLARAAICQSIGEQVLAPDLGNLFPEFQHAGKPTATMAPPPQPTVTAEDARRAIAECGGNRAAASRKLGVGRTTLWRILKG